MHSERVERLREVIAEENIDSFLVSKLSGLRYLFGFTGSSGLGLITGQRSFFVTDFRYKDQAQNEISADEVILADSTLLKSLEQINTDRKIKSLAFVSENTTYEYYISLCKMLKGTKLIPCIDFVQRLSAVKDDTEIENIKNASEITVKVYKEVVPFLKEGVSEKEISTELIYLIHKNGGDRTAFDPIVLFGNNTAMPHGTASENKLKIGDLVQFDFGAVYKGYCSDFSRALIFGKASRQQREIYLAVKEALEKSLEKIQAGQSTRDLDSYSRDILRRRGLSEYFGHSLGHGVGLEIHEEPRISQRSDETFKVGNVFTIEPGVYITGLGGVRIEDLVTLTEDGVRILTPYSHELTAL